MTKKISDALQKALAPEVRARLEASGSLVVPSSAQEYANNLQAEIALTEKMMKAVKRDPDEALLVTIGKQAAYVCIAQSLAANKHATKFRAPHGRA